MIDTHDAAATPSPPARTIARVGLGIFLLLTGLAHLTFARSEFLAQVPAWVPVDHDVVVVVSGVVELALGVGLVALGRYRSAVGWLTAAFFVVIFPGNIAQYTEGVDAFGLSSDSARLARLFFQPVLVVWALWSTQAWQRWRSRGWPSTAPPADSPATRR